MSLSKPEDIRVSWLRSMKQDDASSLSSDDDVSSLLSLPSMGCNCCSHEILCGTCEPDSANPDSILFNKINETEPELFKCCLSGCLNKIGEKDLVYEHIKK